MEEGTLKKFLKFPNTNVQAIDRDINSLSIAKEFEKKFPKDLNFIKLKFSQLDKVSNDYVDTLIFDLRLIIYSIRRSLEDFHLSQIKN